VEGEFVRMNSQKKEGEIIFEQLRLFKQVKNKKIVSKEIINMLQSWKGYDIPLPQPP